MATNVPKVPPKVAAQLPKVKDEEKEKWWTLWRGWKDSKEKTKENKENKMSSKCLLFVDSESWLTCSFPDDDKYLTSPPQLSPTSHSTTSTPATTSVPAPKPWPFLPCHRLHHWKLLPPYTCSMVSRLLQIPSRRRICFLFLFISWYVLFLSFLLTLLTNIYEQTTCTALVP